MNNYPFKVSVLIPVYNAEVYIEKAVDSALSQPETMEVILVEDGSSDKSLLVCERIETKYPKIKLFRHPNGENRGAGASRNLAISKATQGYIAFLDADDYFLMNRFDKTKSVFHKYPDTDGVYECLGTDFLNQRAQDSYQKKNRSLLTTVTRYDIQPEELFQELVLQRNGYFSLDGLTIKRSALHENIHFDETLKIAQDTDFILRLTENRTLRPGELSRPVSMRGVHGENRTLITKNVLKSKHQFSKKWFHRIKNNGWPKLVNRHFLLQYSMASAREKGQGFSRWPKAILNIFKNIYSNPWILRKIL